MADAVGFVETLGIVAAMEAADAALKAAGVSLIDFKKVGSGLISVVVTGEVASVKSAVEAAALAAAKVGQVKNVNVIPRPDFGLKDFL